MLEVQVLGRKGKWMEKSAFLAYKRALEKTGTLLGQGWPAEDGQYFDERFFIDVDTNFIRTEVFEIISQASCTSRQHHHKSAYMLLSTERSGIVFSPSHRSLKLCAIRR